MSAISATRIVRAGFRMPRASRQVHSNINWAHPEHLPFGVTNKRAFTAKYWTFLGVGFSIPFIAGWWQLRKSSGAA
ncbi:cytochrome c oxidase subunit VIIc-domain-containing protein [Cytidiella melzeri]|nr:cytochrome c oxidase subunit VIIc-domain-containing protein [Cytidiella melzeri]